MANAFMKVLTSKRTYWLGLAVGIATWLLANLVGFLKIVDVLNIGGQRVPAATLGATLNIPLGTTVQSLGTASPLGVKAMALLTSIPFAGGFIQGLMDNIMTLFIAVAGSIVLVILGRFVYSIKVFQILPKRKLSVELFYGAVIGTIIIGLPGLGGVGIQALTTMAIYYGIIGIIVVPFLARARWYANLIRD